MNYCKKSGRHWRCIANSARDQRKCQYSEMGNIFCKYQDDVGNCTNALARSFAAREKVNGSE